MALWTHRHDDDAAGNSNDGDGTFGGSIAPRLGLCRVDSAVNGRSVLQRCLLHNKAYRRRAVAFVEHRCDRLGGTLPTPHSHPPIACVLQGEYGIVPPHSVSIGSDEATTCLVVVLRTVIYASTPTLRRGDDNDDDAIDGYAAVAHVDTVDRAERLSAVASDVLQRTTTLSFRDRVVRAHSPSRAVDVEATEQEEEQGRVRRDCRGGDGIVALHVSLVGAYDSRASDCANDLSQMDPLSVDLCVATVDTLRRFAKENVDVVIDLAAVLSLNTTVASRLAPIAASSSSASASASTAAGNDYGRQKREVLLEETDDTVVGTVQSVATPIALGAVLHRTDEGTHVVPSSPFADEGPLAALRRTRFLSPDVSNPHPLDRAHPLHGVIVPAVDDERCDDNGNGEADAYAYRVPPITAPRGLSRTLLQSWSK